MRREPYDLADVEVTDAEAKSNVERLAPRVQLLAQSKTPCFELDGYPKLPVGRAQAFRAWLLRMSAFNAKVTAVRLIADAEQRKRSAKALVDQVSAAEAQIPLTVAYELVKALRDLVDWPDTVQFIDRLPEALRQLPLFVEQRALAQSKSGNHTEAIAALEQLIELAGASPERRGLLGGRYKKLWRESRQANPTLSAGYLDSAIENYEAGRVLDLNSYYASSNLPLLLRSRASGDDPERARRIGISVVAACERAIELKIADEWVYPSLLGAAFHSGDVPKALELEAKVRREPNRWKLETTLADLEDAVALQPDASIKQALAAIVGRLSALLPAITSPV
jgi:tetratricopeptide (TPR) repeat protein